MARLPSGTTPFMQRPTQRADILGLGKTPKRLLKVSGKHFGSQKQANIRNRTPAYSTKWGLLVLRANLCALRGVRHGQLARDIFGSAAPAARGNSLRDRGVLPVLGRGSPNHRRAASARAQVGTCVARSE